MCVSYNYVESFKVLMQLWDEEELVKITDHGGNTFLHAAAINKHTQILNYLLSIASIKDNGNTVNKHGLTTLDILDQCPRDMKSLETREVLLEAGVLRANNLKLTHPKLSTISSNNKQKGFVSRAWARYVNDDHHWIEKQHGILILAALMVAGMSFYSGINPPNKILSNNQNGQFSYLSGWMISIDLLGIIRSL